MSWTWDETLYAGSAEYYPVGRMPYPKAIADVLGQELGLDGTGRLLDVGCGPGSLTLLLAPRFAEAVGVDADGGMLAEAARQAERAGVGNVTWRQLRAEELPAGLGRFRAVTFAQSFHWFDRPRVAELVRGMLEPDGVWVHVAANTHEGVAGEEQLPHPRPPWNDVADLVARYLGAVRRAGQGVLPNGTPGGEEDIMRAAGYRGPTRLEARGAEVAERTEDQIVASVFSLSGSAPHLFGDRRADFERDLRALLRRSSPSGLFSERVREVSMLIWYP